MTTDTPDIRLGDWVSTFGSPANLSNLTVTTGVITKTHLPELPSYRNTDTTGGLMVTKNFNASVESYVSVGVQEILLCTKAFKEKILRPFATVTTTESTLVWFNGEGYD